MHKINISSLKQFENNLNDFIKTSELSNIPIEYLNKLKNISSTIHDDINDYNNKLETIELKPDSIYQGVGIPRINDIVFMEGGTVRIIGVDDTNKHGTVVAFQIKHNNNTWGALCTASLKEFNKDVLQLYT